MIYNIKTAGLNHAKTIIEVDKHYILTYNKIKRRVKNVFIYVII